MIPIIYATTTGRTEQVCQKISKVLGQAGIENKLMLASSTTVEIFKQADCFILATSTWGEGQVSTQFEVLSEKMRKLNLQGKKFAFIGLGEKRYGSHFCRGITILQKIVEEAQGEKISEVLKIDGDPNNVLLAIEDWGKQLVKMISHA